jgi:glycosyltransferase involved in cell wall biosynthesis
MRVLMVNYEYPPLGGGGGVVTHDLAHALADRVDITILTSHQEGLPRDEVKNGLRIVRTPVWLRHAKSVASLPSMLSFFPSSLRTAKRLAAEQSYDLVHSFFAVPTGPSGVIMARRMGVPHVLSIMGGDIYDPTKALSPHKTPVLKQVVKRVIRKSQRVVAESVDIASRAEEFYAAKGVERIPHGFVPVKYEPLGRDELGGWKPDDFICIAVGRIVARKGLDQLVEIVASVPDVHLVVVGDGPLREDLAAQAKAAGAADRIQFTGFVSEERKWQLLEAADVFTYTTLHEGFGLVYLEAMATSTPVLTYDCGGQADFVSEDFGYLVPVGDKTEFKSRLIQLRDDTALREKMGRAAREKSKAYEIGPYADQYLKVYEECLAAWPAEKGR